MRKQIYIICDTIGIRKEEQDRTFAPFIFRNYFYIECFVINYDLLYNKLKYE